MVTANVVFEGGEFREESYDASPAIWLKADQVNYIGLE